MDELLNLQMANAVGAARSNTQAPNIEGARTEAEARAVAEEFESFFLSQMVSAMFANVGEENPFGGGAGEKAFAGVALRPWPLSPRLDTETYFQSSVVTRPMQHHSA